MRAITIMLISSALWLGGPSIALGQAADASPPAAPDPRIYPLARDYQPAADLVFRVVSPMSEGVRLHAELFYPKAQEGRKLPTVVMAHGWGGVAALLRRDASDLARTGYLVIVFDYRGWGESDARVILTNPGASAAGAEKFTAEVQSIRGYIDPFEQVDDWFSVIDWAAGEPMVDMSRLGLRGSSYSGGHVVFVAGRDQRVKAIVSQVAGIASRPEPGAAPGPYARTAREQGTRMARGELGYPPPRAKAFGDLIGAPVGDKLLRWWPNDEASHLTAAALFIVAEREELVANSSNAERAYERAIGPKKLVVIPGIRHYGIYTEAREQAIKLAIEWVDQYLKGDSSGKK
jgi:dienelactone hydrolase